jgi:hypothetical protein
VLSRTASPAITFGQTLGHDKVPHVGKLHAPSSTLLSASLLSGSHIAHVHHRCGHILPVYATDGHIFSG